MPTIVTVMAEAAPTKLVGTGAVDQRRGAD